MFNWKSNEKKLAFICMMMPGVVQNLSAASLKHLHNSLSENRFTWFRLFTAVVQTHSVGVLGSDEKGRKPSFGSEFNFHYFAYVSTLSSGLKRSERRRGLFVIGSMLSQNFSSWWAPDVGLNELLSLDMRWRWRIKNRKEIQLIMLRSYFCNQKICFWWRSPVIRVQC